MLSRLDWRNARGGERNLRPDVGRFHWGDGETATGQYSRVRNEDESPLCRLLQRDDVHVLDYDDAHSGPRTHPSASLIPALLSVAEHSGLPGASRITAFVLGFEITIRVGLALERKYYDAGWHPTSVLRRFGAAAGVGKLLNLDVRQLCSAFGLAATQAGGLRDVFGTMGKPFHAGKAAMDGALSALLAQKGFRVPEDILNEKLRISCRFFVRV
jgi:2-methylcitrate dehydratase PrpD